MVAGSERCDVYRKEKIHKERWIAEEGAVV